MIKLVAQHGGFTRSSITTRRYSRLVYSESDSRSKRHWLSEAGTSQYLRNCSVSGTEYSSKIRSRPISKSL